MNPKEPPADERPKTAESEPAPVPLDKAKLTAEEQMALYEEALKEADWGHQPC